MSTTPDALARLLAPIVRAYAWQRVPAPADDPLPWYHVVLQTPDGRRFGRLLICHGTPDDFLQTVASFVALHPARKNDWLDTSWRRL